MLLRRRWIRASLSFLLTGLCLVLASRPSHAADQPYSGFHIDLRQVSHLYDTSYRDRVTDVLDVDSTVTFDWEHIKFGNQRYHVKTFLPTDWDTTRTVVDYTVIPGYRTVFTVPKTTSFENLPEDVGDLTLTQVRDYSVPGLKFEIKSIDEVANDIQRETLQSAWKESIRQNVMTAPTPGEQAAGGIKFNVPLPMPKSLESIFGPGDKTSITIRGREEITIAGETHITKPFIGIEGRQSQSLFPSLDMQQKLDVSLTGTIGDKVAIQVDHSSEAIGDNANRVRLAYTGYEDEVIQLIELGNTSLSLPGSQLVSVSTSAQGLFGVKMLAKVGSTDFTLIASKQEGENSNATFQPTGGALGQSETVTINDVDYIRNKYFYFDDPRAFIGPRTENPQIEVYRTVTQADFVAHPEITRIPGLVVPDPVGDGQSIRDVAAMLNAGITPPDNVALAQDFQLLTFGEDYDFIIDAKSNQTIGIELFDPIPDTALKALAVSYINRDGAAVGGSFATLGVNKPGQESHVMLKMLKHPDPRPQGPYGSVWRLMIRNIYNLGLTNIDQTSLKVDIEDIINTQRLNSDTPAGSDVKYLKIFGLDQTDRTGTGKPDGLIDLTYGFVDLNNGLLQFPSIEAFAPDDSNVTTWSEGKFAFTGAYADQYAKSKSIYEQLLSPQQQLDAHQYEIHVSAVSTSKTFRINALKIVEGSETIKIGGDILARGTDYDIDYDTGEVTLKEPALAKLTPNAQVSVDYQFKPLGGLGQSTLAGMSSVSKLGENLRIGTTILYESRSSSETRPRLGEEPSRAIVGGVTASYQHQSRLLTDLANLLPRVDTDAPSTINLDGEVAASFPNPNTKHEAYIEDFEGTEDADHITLSRRSWYPASLPFDALGTQKLPDQRLNFIWYNIEPEHGVHRRDLNPTLDKKENTLVQSMDIDLDSTPTSATDASYAGIMLGIPNGGLDISQGQFIEIWVNDFKPDPLSRHGQLHIDLGLIDENFHNPAENKFDDEDKNRDGFAAAFDDTGLDGLFDSEGTPNEGATSANPDPAGDDIDLSRDAITHRYEKVNGTEGNLIYDTEDLDRNGQMTRDNAYFSYVVNLDDSADVDIRRQYPGYDGFDKEGHENDSWRLYRIPLNKDTIVKKSGIDPRFDEIRHVRIWFDQASQVIRPIRNKYDRDDNRIQIAEFSINGNRWEVDGVHDLAENVVDADTTTIGIGAISTKTDPGVYNPPVNPNKQNQVSDKESSLALRYQNLPEGEQVRILKRFLGQGQDMTLYRDLNFWVHTDQLRTGMEYYFRLGSNENNYYEIAVPFTSKLYNETGWARVVVKTAQITDLKFVTGGSGAVTGVATDSADPSHTYPIKMVGTPSLQSVRFLYAGVRNNSNPDPQSGEVWLDDIFSGDVQRNFDHAERLSANVSLAGGALSVGGNWARTGADYRGLRQKRGTGSDDTILNLNARTDLQYFLPLAGFSVPLSVGYGHNTSLPKFPPNSDTEIVDAAVQDSLRTESTSKSFTTSLARRTASKSFLMRYTFDALRPSFSYGKNETTSPAQRDTSTTIAGSIAYQLNWAGSKTLPLIGKNRVRWWPNSFDFSTNATRSEGQSWSYRDGEFHKDPFRYSATVISQGNVRYNPFRSLESSFGMSINRDASIPHDWMGFDIGTETARSNNARLSFVPPRSWYGISIFEPSVELQSRYNENSSPNVRGPGDPVGTLNADASRDDTGRIRFDLARHIGSVFKLFGVNVDELQGNTQGGGGGQHRGEQPHPQGGQPDSTGHIPPDSTHTAQPGTRHGVDPLRGFARALLNVRPISANIQHRVSSSYLRIPERPDMIYRLGIDTNAGLDSIGKPDTKRGSLSFNVDSGVQLTRSFDVQGRYTRATTDQDFRTSGQSRTLATTWPDLQAKWDGLGNFRPLRPILTNGSVNMNYKATHAENGQKGQPPVSTSETLALSPAVDMTWKNTMQTTLSVSYSKATNDTRGSKSQTNSQGVSLDLKRDFRGGGGIGFLGKKMNWNNDLETSLSITYSKAGGERTVLGGFSEPIPASTSWRVFPTVRYTFSKNINGSAFIDYGRQYAEATRQTTTTVRVGVTAVVTF
ncbi:MAG TPA: cell surface protein SprA [Candidatus Krumholzibacteria bacterium]|nr:cell surface protein SprA [Candidatus Krumholzibacteria bacterium]